MFTKTLPLALLALSLTACADKPQQPQHGQGEDEVADGTAPDDEHARICLHSRINTRAARRRGGPGA